MFALISKINPGALWLIFAIVTDVLSTFYSAKGNGLVNKTAQGIALVLYIISFACAAIALKYMQLEFYMCCGLVWGYWRPLFSQRFFLGKTLMSQDGLGLVLLQSA